MSRKPESSPLWMRHKPHQQCAAGAYLGYSGYAAVLACTKRPVHAKKVVAITGIAERQVTKLLEQFRALRLVHRSGWVKHAKGCYDHPVYLLGDGADAPAKINRRSKKFSPFAASRHEPSLRVGIFARVIKLLQDDCWSTGALAEASGLNTTRLRELREYMAQPGVRLIYVADWKWRGVPGGGPMRLWEFGADKEDAPKPPNRARECRDALREIGSIQRYPRWESTVAMLRRNAGFRVGFSPSVVGLPAKTKPKEIA